MGGVICFAVYSGFGWPGLAVVLVLVVVCACTLYVLHLCRSWRERHEDRKRKAEPCVHGITGAKYDVKLCDICACEVEARRLEQERRALEEKQRKQAVREAVRRWQYREWVKKMRLPEYLKTVDPEEFEKIVCRLFTKLGYRVEATPYVADGGSDGYLYKDNEKSVLQCKRVQGSVGEPVFRDLFGTMHRNHCHKAILVTTGTVTRQARAWVAGQPIRIIDLEELQQLFRSNFNEDDVIPDNFSIGEPKLAPNELRRPGVSSLCPRCGKKLRVVNGRRGRFIGCTGYPGCRYTRTYAP